MIRPQPASRSPDLCDCALPYVRAIAPYQPGKPVSELAREIGLEQSGIVKLASNENPLGASPKALAAARAALAEAGRYPDGNGFDLKQALAERYRLSQENIILGNGSNDVLELAARAFLAPGASAVYSQHAFAVYPLAVQATGAEGIEVRARDFGHDLGAMAAAVRADTRVIFVANPNNPTGTWVPPEAVLEFLKRIPGNVLVVLDEAYNEYLPVAEQADITGWLARFPNLLVSRTFSKAYGLAGLRVGYGLAQPQIADLLNRVRQPFNVNSVALAAALAALDDEAFVRKSVELNEAGMRQITHGLGALGLEWIPSRANFLSFRAGKAMQVYRRLLELGVIVRPVGAYAMPEHLRVTIGLEAENRRFLEGLQSALQGAS
jgi:histidinol-phosphate aminotransferase